MTPDDRTVNAEIGQRIRAVREDDGRSQQALADLGGMGQSVWSRIETGQRMVTVAEFLTIADALGVEPCELLGCR